MSKMKAVYTIYVPEGDENCRFKDSLNVEEQSKLHVGMWAAWRLFKALILAKRRWEDYDPCPKP